VRGLSVMVSSTYDRVADDWPAVQAEFQFSLDGPALFSDFEYKTAYIVWRLHFLCQPF
jgi:hypothetical protein